MFKSKYQIKISSIRYHVPNRTHLAFIFLVLIALCLRLWELDGRVMHYDEAIHLHYSWKLANLEIFRHSPWMHGPLQIEFVALAINLFGDNDFVARSLYAIIGSLLVGLPYFLRDQLGRFGALSVSIMLMLSPSLLYFSRFGRNDILMAFWTVSLFILMIRYIYHDKNYYLYLASAVLALMFCTKETSYLVVFIIGSISLLIALPDLLPCFWRRGKFKHLTGSAGFFLLILFLTLPQWSALSGLLQGIFGLTLINPNDAGIGLAGTPHWGDQFVSFPVLEIAQSIQIVIGTSLFILVTYLNHIRSRSYRNGILTTFLGLGFGASAVFIGTEPMSYGMQGTVIANSPMYILGLVIATLTGAILICKHLLSYDVSISGIITTAFITLVYTLLFTNIPDADSFLTRVIPSEIDIDIHPGFIALNYLVSLIIIATAVSLSIYLGFKWKQGVWVRCASIFYFIWITLYTTVYTNWAGIFTGGWQGLGYWIAQQEVAWGNQPWYYYLVGLSTYELLPLLFGIAACIYYIKKADPLGLILVSWSLLTLLAFTIASEKMPWLLVGVVVPLIFLVGKYLDDLYCQINWSKVARGWPLALFCLIPIQLIGWFYIFYTWISSDSGFALIQVALISSLIITVPILAYLIRIAKPRNGFALVGLICAIMVLATSVFGAFRASYIFDDSTVELLAYAQGSHDVREAYQELENQVLSNDMAPKTVRVDYELWYPMQWYGRNYEKMKQLQFACFKSEGDDGWNSSCNELTDMPNDGAILLLSTHGYRDANMLSDYQRSKPLNNLLWFPESYRRPHENRQQENILQELKLDFEFFKSVAFQRDTWKQAINYILFRDIESSWYSSEFFSYMPRT